MKKIYLAPSARITDSGDIVCASGEPEPLVCTYIDYWFILTAAEYGITLIPGVSTVAEAMEAAAMLEALTGMPWPFSVDAWEGEVWCNIIRDV